MKPREFWIHLTPHGWIVHFEPITSISKVIHVREVVTMPSEDEIASLSYEYDIPTHRNCMGCCQSDSDYEQAWQAGFKKALELMGYRK